MKSRSIFINAVVLGVALAAVALGQSTTVKSSSATHKASHAMMPAKTGARKAQHTDASIQECIQQKLDAAPKLKADSITVTVDKGIATFAGAVRNAGDKGAVVSIARSCGAKKVMNNIMVEAMKKPVVLPKVKSSSPGKSAKNN